MIWPPLQPAAPRAREDGALELTPRRDGVDKKRRVQSMPANWHQVGSDLTALAENGPLGKIPTTLQMMLTSFSTESAHNAVSKHDRLAGLGCTGPGSL